MTQLELINAALDQLGAEPITAGQFAAGSPLRAGAAVRQWPMALAEFLADHPWKFAQTRVEIEADETAPAFGWACRFALPADFVTIVALNDTEAGSGSDLWEIEGGYLLANNDPAQLKYIYTPADEDLADFLALMDSKAQAAFVYLLAARLAVPIAKDGAALHGFLIRLYRSALNEARTKAFNERHEARPDQRVDSRYLSVRGGTSALGTIAEGS